MESERLPLENDIESRRGRKTWKRNFDFIINIIGMTIGLGNVWRFPYLCYKNGGGAFLIPYVIIVVVVALPLIILETALGQYTGYSAVKAWNLVPIMRGIGFASPVMLFLVNIYYPMILTWALRWLVASFSSILPWTTCNNSWNTIGCLPVIFQDTSSSVTNHSRALGKITNSTIHEESSTEEYWKRNILELSSGVEEMGGVKLELLACLAVIWILTYFCIWKGIDWTSKIVYFTATLPLAMILVVVIRGATLPGAYEGIQFYIRPNVTRLQDIEIWADATSQVLFSTCVCSGVLVSLSKYNSYHHNFFRDTLILIFANAAASFTAGFAIFSVLGYLTKNQNASIAEVAESGPGLVFVAYPTALALLPIPQLWSVLFFLMIILLGFDSQFIYQETFVACVEDIYPKLFDKKWGREITVAVASFIMFLLGIIMVTRGGMYVFYIFDQYAVAGWCMFFMGVCEFIAIGWIYNANEFCDHIREMLGYNVPRMWLIFCWKFTGPVITVMIMIYSLVKYKPLQYDRKYTYPAWANIFGWCLAFSSMLWIPCTVIRKLLMGKRPSNSEVESGKTKSRFGRKLSDTERKSKL